MTLGSVAIKGTSVVLAFVLSLVLARVLGVSEYGTYEFVLAWFMILAIVATFGLEKLTVRVIAAATAHNDWSLARGFVKWSNWTVLVSGSLLGLLGAVITYIIAGRAITPSVIAMWVGCALLPITALTVVVEASVRGLHHVIAGQLPILVIRPFVLLASIVTIAFVAVGDVTAIHALVAMLGATLVALAFAAISFQRAAPQPLRFARPRATPLRWVGAALPMMVMGALTTSNSRIGTIMLGALHGPDAAGVYAVAVRGADLVIVAMVAINTALAPTFAGLFAAGDLSRLQTIVTKSARLMLLFALPLIVALFALADRYTLLFGDDFLVGAPALRILLIGQLVNSVAGSVGLLLMMANRERVAMVGVGIGVTVNFGLTAVLVPLYGMLGAALAATLSTVVWNAILWAMVVRYLSIHPTAFGAPQRASP